MAIAMLVYRKKEGGEKPCFFHNLNSLFPVSMVFFISLPSHLTSFKTFFASVHFIQRTTLVP